jgi:exosortase
MLDNMSTAPAHTAAHHVTIPAIGPLRVAALVAAFGWCYWPVIPGLVAQWLNEPEYSHGILVPFISAYLIWSRRDALRAVPLTPGYAGLGVIALATLMYLAGSVGADLFLQRSSFVVMLAGAVLFVAGPIALRLVLFPLTLLLLMIPLPGILFNAIAFPLQLFAAQVASRVLELCDVPVFREGNVMHLAAASLDVEEACSGIRSLMSLTTLSIVYVYLIHKSWISRVLLVAAVIPIAIIANVFRVTVTGLLAHYASVETAMNVFHTASGITVFLAAAAMLFGFSHLLRLSGVPE